MNPEGSNTNEAAKNSKEELVQFSDHPSFNMGYAICWLVAIAAVFITVFFWWLSKDASDTLAVKTKEKADIIAEITSPTNVEVERKASAFKSSVNALEQAQKERFGMNKFLKDLYTKVTNDMVIKTADVSADGTVSLTGSGPSYRSVADLMVALKSWDAVTEVDLNSVSLQEDQSKNIVAVFSISAKVNKEKYKSSSATIGTSPSGASLGNTVSSLEGGYNAEVQ